MYLKSIFTLGFCQNCRLGLTLCSESTYNLAMKFNIRRKPFVMTHSCVLISKKCFRNYYNFTNKNSKSVISSGKELSIVLRQVSSFPNEFEKMVEIPKVKTYINNLMLEYKENNSKVEKEKPTFSIKTASLLERKISLEENMHLLQELLQSGEKSSKGDKQLLQLVEEEKKEYIDKLKEIEVEILKSLLPKLPVDKCNGVVLEISAGVGGQEAMLFAKDLYNMYTGYVQHRGWAMDVADYDSSELGGIRHASLIITGKECYKYLNAEGGVHRVQRIPATEKSGRIHTSTVTVAVFPQPEEVDILINDKDLKIETKRASGAGGQHVNTTDSAVRIVYLPTGLSVECQKERSQLKNKEIALQKLRAKLYEAKLNQQMSEMKSSRKNQVGTSGRSEKIRTYNFNQDRITDHRLSSNAHNLVEFLQGGEPFHRLVQQLVDGQEQQKIDDLIENISI